MAGKGRARFIRSGGRAICLVVAFLIAGETGTYLAGDPTIPKLRGTSPTTASLDFDGTPLGRWIEQVAAPNRIQVVPDPAGGSDDVLRVTADNVDVAPLTPTDNPRAELNTPMDILKPDGRYWESYEVYVPTSFNVADSYDGWLSLGSPFYGSPFAGTPPIEMMIMDDEFLWGSNRDSQVPGTVLFRKPLVLGQWVRFTWHIFPSNNGFVELYVNNEPVVSTYNGSTGLGVDIPVLDETDDKGPWYAQLSVYYEYGEYPSVTLYFKNFRIASTLAAAAGW